MIQASLDPRKLIFPRTASHRGRAVCVSPQNSDFDYLHYARTRLDSTLPRVEFATGKMETALLCMGGRCRIVVGGDAHDIELHDAIYIPPGSTVEVTSDSDADLVECSAEVSGSYAVQVVRYADVLKSPMQRFRSGGPSTSRDLNIIIGENVKAGRILAGFTRSIPGNWTSWPPHEHSATLEELYVYFDMPPPAFGIQMVYTKPDEPEFVSIVRDGDAVLMPAGYHPNVAAPGHSINFIWMMAARREVEDRQFGVVNVQPGFGEGGSGLEASRIQSPR